MITGSVFNQIIALFLIILTGYAIRKLNAVERQFEKGLVDFIMNIAIPALTISSMAYKFSFDTLKNCGIVIIVCIILSAVLVIIAYAVTFFLKAGDATKDVYRFMLIFANTGFVGFPIINAAYGKVGVFYTAVYNLPYNILMWTVGLIILNSRKMKMSAKSMINPGTVSVLAGFVIFILSIKIPSPIASAIKMTGDLATPLSMIYIGFNLADADIKNIFTDITAFFMCILRLIIIPLLFFMMLKPFIKDPLILNIITILSAMPAAANTAIFAGKLGSDKHTASWVVCLSTIMSIATLPFIIYIINLGS
ncbi:MAG: AEC family transporter [Clostridiales bacterium]|nr:AEC family transporter [Clostridiales bacterium]